MYHFIILHELKNEDLMSALEDVDIVMIANLVKMIIVGSYNSFVSKTHGFDGEQVSSGMLKVKMATSVVGVSSIHLLQTFLNAECVTTDVLRTQLILHGAFIVGAVALAFIDFLHLKGEHSKHS